MLSIERNSVIFRTWCRQPAARAARRHCVTKQLDKFAPFHQFIPTEALHSGSPAFLNPSRKRATTSGLQNSGCF